MRESEYPGGSVLSPRLDGGVLPWDAEAEASAIWRWIKDLDLVSGAATHQEAVLYMGQVMKMKRVGLFCGRRKEGDTVGGMRGFDVGLKAERDVAASLPAGVPPLQPESISSPSPGLGRWSH